MDKVGILEVDGEIIVMSNYEDAVVLMLCKLDGRDVEYKVYKDVWGGLRITAAYEEGQTCINRVGIVTERKIAYT